MARKRNENHHYDVRLDDDEKTTWHASSYWWGFRNLHVTGFNGRKVVIPRQHVVSIEKVD